MIVRNMSEVPNFDAKETLCIDIETTSFDDNIKGLMPFQGTRSCGYAISTLDNKRQWYLPIRHRAGGNLPLDNAKKYLQDVIGSGRDIVNHNIHFDACVWHFDGCKCKGNLLDTMALARLWKSDLLRLSLDALTGGAKDKRVKEYLKSIKSKDYGAVPINMLGPYAKQDVKITVKLYHDLMKKLRSEALGVWDTECRLNQPLVDARIHGIRVDWKLLRITYRNMLRRMLEVNAELDVIAGYEVDYGSEKETNELLINRLGIKPISFTKTGKPQWDGKTLDNIEHPIAQPLKEYNHLFHFTNTYCKGWLKRKGDDGRIHATFKTYGTKTGRLSATDPNLQNVTAEAEVFVLPDDGCFILGGDYSQIEYRLFAHYAQDLKIIAAYANNPKMDYHQLLADRLGVDRAFAKSLNFAFLYGMGTKKLLTMIAGICAVNAKDANMVSRMRTFLTGGASATARAAEKMDLREFTEIAFNIYTTYHKEVPSVRVLKARVKKAIIRRGWLKNYCGRIYTVPPQASYKGVNMLIQGSAADIFKERLLHVLETMPNLQLISNVHDSVFFSAPYDKIQEMCKEFQERMEDVEGVRIPLAFSLKAAVKSWGTCMEFKDPGEIESILEKSKNVTGREWGHSGQVQS